LKDSLNISLPAYRWVILGLLCGLYASFGLISRAIAPLVTPMIQDLGISYAEMGLILGAWQVTYILVSLVNGPIIDRWGIRQSLFVGALVISFSACLRYFPTGFLSMLFAVALFGVGGPMISIGGPKAIALWFEDKSRGTAIGIFMAGNIGGGLAALALTNSLVMPRLHDNWRATFVLYGAIAFLIAVLWVVLARDKPASAGDESEAMLRVFRRLISIRRVQVILLMGLCSFGIFHGLSSWLPKIMETGGLSPAMAGFAASIPSISAIPAIIFVPRWIPHHLRGKAIAVFALTSAALIFVVTTATGIALVSGLVLLGIANSGIMPLMLLILMDSPEIGSRHMGAAGGLFFCVAEIGGVLGPFVMGALVDITGAFLAGAFFMAVLGLTVTVLAWSLRFQNP